MLKLYKFFWDCGRMGDIDGLFVAEESVVKSAIGKDVYLGEALGKHSEVSGILEEKDIEVVSEDQEKIEWLVNLLGYGISGYNPLEYINEDSEEEDEE